MIGLKDKIPDEEDRRQHIFQNMLYGISITELTAMMARRSLYTSKDAASEASIARFNLTDGNIDYENRAHTYVSGSCKYCGNKVTDTQLGGRSEDKERHAYKFIHLTTEEAQKMKFDVIVGNPPYQLNDGGNGASAAPIYQLFIQQAKKLNPRYMAFIIPSRWFAGGKGLDKFRDEMLNDNRIRIIYDYPDANDCFPGVLISGGVMYFVWNATNPGKCEIHTITGDDELPVMKRDLNEFDVFIRENQAVPILKKVKGKNEETLDKIASSRKPFGLATNFADFDLADNPDKYKIYSSNQVGVRKVGYVQKSLITKGHNLIDKWKVLMPKAYRIGSSKDGGYINAIIAEPNSVATETFIVLGVFNSKEESENFVKYIKTRLFRFLVSLRKITQDATAKVYAFVPNLTMDQVWTDEKLYERYNITPSEQKFIESMIKEMK
jgi:site-specific DNA-methyltransferase (adenine-specific)